MKEASNVPSVLMNTVTPAGAWDLMNAFCWFDLYASQNETLYNIAVRT